MGLSAQEGKQEMTKVISHVENGGKSTKCIHFFQTLLQYD